MMRICCWRWHAKTTLTRQGGPRSSWTGRRTAEEFNDDRSGKKLDPKKVRQARDEELVELERRVYVEVDVEECVKVTEKKPIQAWRRSGRRLGSVQSCCTPCTGCGLLPAAGSGVLSDLGGGADLFWGLPSKCTFFHPVRTIRIVVHGDDFVIEGGQEDLDWTKGVLANKYLVKVRSILGPEHQGRQGC